MRGRVLITGASGGIGEAFAVLLASAEGHSLGLVARNEGELNRVKGVISARHEVEVDVFALDLGLPESGARLAAMLEQRGFVPDILINNAGFGLAGNAVDLSRDEQLRMIDLNIRALTDLSLRFLPAMIAQPQWRHYQCRIGRRLHAGAGHGSLFCNQGLCAFFQRRACRKNCAVPASP